MTGFPTHLLLTQGALLGSFISDLLGTLSKDVFEPRTPTGSEAFSLFICLDANKLVLLSFFSLLKTIYPRVSTKPLPNDAKSPLPVDVRRSTTLLLKLPINTYFSLRAKCWHRGGICGSFPETYNNPNLSFFFKNDYSISDRYLLNSRF